MFLVRIIQNFMAIYLVHQKESRKKFYLRQDLNPGPSTPNGFWTDALDHLATVRLNTTICSPESLIRQIEISFFKNKIKEILDLRNN